MATDIYRPEIWSGFFQLVGTASAALTGLVFVSMSLNLDIITQDVTHRNRAIGTLAGLAAIFMACAFAIMGGQNHLAVGAELLIVSSTAATIYVHGYLQSLKQQGSTVGLNYTRITIGASCYAVEIIGALILTLGHIMGLYIAAAAIILNVPFLISGVWLLLVGVHQDLTKQQKSRSRKR
ncbi:MAG: hypothetical protein JWO41_461 [Candidatus Saccharibacteria bacterium]|nr:hypothetical protein [Candidatus Saccharibacteria bacterium]